MSITEGQKGAASSKKILLLAVLLVGCVEEPPPQTCTDANLLASERPDLPLVGETEHLDIYASSELAVCAGMPAEYERHIAFVAAQLGVEPRAHIPLYLLAQDAPNAVACGAFSSCTTNDGVIVSRVLSSYHELTHGVACQIRYGSIPALAEGLAVMFEPEPVNASPNSDGVVSLADLIAKPYPLAASYYPNAGHMTRWLYERDGADAFVDLYWAAERTETLGVDVEALEETMMTIYSRTLDDLGAEYIGTAPYAWAPFRQCADVPLLEVDANGEWSWSAVLDCGSETTLGPYARRQPAVADASQMMYQSFLVNVETDATYGVEFQGAKQVEFERCGERHATDADDEGLVFDRAAVLWNSSEVALTRGLWRADVLDYASSPGVAMVRISPK